MASPLQLEFLKVLASLAWADEEVTGAERNFINHLVRHFQLSGEEWAQVEMYLEEKVALDEMKRVTRRFLSRVRGRKAHQMLVDSARQMLEHNQGLTEREREWMRSLQELVSETTSNSFLLDGLKSLLRIGGRDTELSDGDRELEFHDFIHNRVLFKLRRALGATRLEEAGTPEQLKKLTLGAALLARIGYVDDEFLPQEESCLRRLLGEFWGVSTATADAVAHIAMEAVRRGFDDYRVLQETKMTFTLPERKRLVDAMFGLARAEGKMSHHEVEEIRKVAYSLELTHGEFIDAKVRVLQQ